MDELNPTYGRMELAQLYFPHICGRAAWRKLKDVMIDDPALRPLADTIVAIRRHPRQQETPASV